MEVDTIVVNWKNDTKPEGAKEIDGNKENSKDFTYILSSRGYNGQKERLVDKNKDFDLKICGGGTTTKKLFFCISRKKGVKDIIGEETLLDNKAYFKITATLVCRESETSQPQTVFMNFYRKNCNGKPYNVTASSREFTVNRQWCEGIGCRLI